MVVKHFSKLDLSPKELANTAMGDVSRTSCTRRSTRRGRPQVTSTPRGAIKLMVDILITNDDDGSQARALLRSIYDLTAGSGGMLLVAQDALKRMNEKIDVTLYGQGTHAVGVRPR